MLRDECTASRSDDDIFWKGVDEFRCVEWMLK